MKKNRISIFLITHFHWVFILGFVASHFVPWPFYGPSMSCFAAAGEVTNDQKTANYAKWVEYDFIKVQIYLENSDFYLARSNDRDYGKSYVFLNNADNYKCLILGLFSFDSSIVVVHVEEKNGIEKVIHVGQKKV